MRDLLICVAMASLPLATAVAQAANEFDFEPAWLPVTTIAPNGPTHVVSVPTTYVGQNLELTAPLTIAPGAELRLVGVVALMAALVVVARVSLP